jgi:hypothetical protein
VADKKGTTNFSGGEYASAIAAAKGRKVPLGGAPMPEMPRLDGPIPDKAVGAQSVRAAQKVLTPEQMERLNQQGRLRQGVGAGYVVNQPQLPTDEEGNPQEIDPRLVPRPEGAGLRPETVQQLAEVAKANQEAKKDENDTELKKIRDEIDEIDDVFETNEFGERVRSILSNKKRKAAIESRCEAMKFEDLLITGSVQQRVPIIPNRFEPTYRSPSGAEDLEVKRIMGQVRGTEQYILDTFSIYGLTLGLYSINGKPLPSHLKGDGEFDETLFKTKYAIISKMGLPILADLVVNYMWFGRRVQKLTVYDDIKGF